MKTERKSEIKGALKTIIAIAVLGCAIGVGFATTVITDDGIYIDSNPVIVEGDYTTWTHVWTNDIPGGLLLWNNFAAHIDDINDKIYLMWDDNAGDEMFGVYNVADFSEVFKSPALSAYTWSPPFVGNEDTIRRGWSVPWMGGGSVSLYSYVLLLRVDKDTIEVWRGDLIIPWMHDTSIDEAATEVRGGMISLKGKYVLIQTANNKLILYKGS